jgi:P4 family phage/plasmid primase-like protien
MNTRPLPTDDEILAATRRLGDSWARDYLVDRHVSIGVMEELELGWDDERVWYPVRDVDGKLVNVRRHKPRSKEYKYINWPGFGTGTRLNFLSSLALDPEWAVVVGGENDAASAITEGIPAVCGTNGEGSVPKAEYLKAFAGRKVIIALDNDDSGRTAAQKWAKKLRAVAREVVVVALPGEGTDFNVWIKLGNGWNNLMELVEASRPGHRPAEQLVEMALAKVEDEGGRNNACSWLAQQMRDEKYTQDEAWELAVQPFQQEVDSPDKPFREDEARQTLVSAFAGPARAPSGITGPRSAFYQTESGNAERLVAAHGHEMRFVSEMGKASQGTWFVWDGVSWAVNDSSVMKWTLKIARDMRAEAAELDEDEAKALATWAHQSESRQKRQASVELARHEPGVKTPLTAFDANPMLLNVLNGVLDLGKGILRDHDPADLMRKLAPVAYDPKAKAPKFLKFLERVQPDPEIRAFLQRAVGYSLTGRTDEHKLLWLRGTGRNGKSTFVEIVRAMLGTYAVPLTASALEEKAGGEGISNDVARINGARFVPVPEYKRSAQLNERRIKELTGGDTVSARFLHNEFFEFQPQGKLWVSSNYAPIISGADDGIWSRLLLVQFGETIAEAERDLTLKSRIVAGELSGVLSWAMEGLAAWLKVGLSAPAAIRSATSAYRKDSDLLGLFLEDCCELDVQAFTSKISLFSEWTAWAEQNGHRVMNTNSFGRMINDRPDLQIEDVRRSEGRGWAGVRLRSVIEGTPGRRTLHAVPPLETPVGSAAESDRNATGMRPTPTTKKRKR